MKNLALLLLSFLFCLSACKTNVHEAAPNPAKIQNAESKIVENLNGSRQAPLEDMPLNDATSSKNIKTVVGNIESDTSSVCLKIQNNTLNVGDNVQIILTELPQEVFQAKIVEKGTCKSEPFADLSKDNLTDYSLESADKSSLGRGYGLGIVKTTQLAQVTNNYATLDIDGDGKVEYFRDCTSNEGAHFTVWDGKPLKGKRIWHSYYHFNYDTDPTCKEKDYKGINE